MQIQTDRSGGNPKIAYMSDNEKAFVEELEILFVKYDVSISTDEDENDEGNLYLMGYTIGGSSIHVDIDDLKKMLRMKSKIGRGN